MQNIQIKSILRAGESGPNLPLWLTTSCMKMPACSVLLGNTAFAQPRYCAESSNPEQMQRYHRIMCDGCVCVGREAAPKPFFPAASLLRKPAVLQLALRSCVVCLPAIMLMTSFRFNTSADVK